MPEHTPQAPSPATPRQDTTASTPEVTPDLAAKADRLTRAGAACETPIANDPHEKKSFGLTPPRTDGIHIGAELGMCRLSPVTPNRRELNHSASSNDAASRLKPEQRFKGRIVREVGKPRKRRVAERILSRATKLKMVDDALRDARKAGVSAADLARLIDLHSDLAGDSAPATAPDPAMMSAYLRAQSQQGRDAGAEVSATLEAASVDPARIE